MSASEAQLRIALLDSIPEWGGGQKWDVDTARGLAARGHVVAVACLRGSALEARARAAGLPVFSAARGPLGWRFGSALAFARFLRRERIGFVIANVGRDVRLGALAGALAGAVLLQRRGLLRPLGRGPLTRWLYTRRVRRVIANSEALRRLLLESAPYLGERVVTLPNAIAPASAGGGARLRAELGISESAPLVGAVGRLAPMKGFEHLLAAWPAVRAAHPGARLVIFGAGALEGELRAQAARLGVSASITLAGFREDVAALYDALDVFVLPSLRDESTSHAALEAMAHGKPAVLSDRAGASELPPGTCHVVPAGDADALGAALAELLGDLVARERIGRAARDAVLHEHAPARVLDRLEGILRDSARG